MIEWVEPMKAVLTEERFSDAGWVFERKLDGLRCLAFKDDGGVRMLSRNRLSFNERFPDIARALEREPAADFVIHGPGAHGIPGMVNLYGIESPGLTSSMAIADYVAELLGVGPTSET